ncbi:putative type VI secretion system effector [Burkholderia guangdongensis]|uniref:putative type VI secretion system effector n=1 Tax=Burkholderia guangdongensis TaxID=1792500 RepID=UPI0015CE323F|nr:putative type VI secretion system effector [Burkholderia guangdongensis]
MKNQELKIPTVLLSGTISNLERSRRTHDFVLTQVQHGQIGVTAAAASAMGMGAMGVGLISMAGNADEEADWVQFNLDTKQVDGWLWMMPMRNGDKVEVVAEQIGENRYVAYAVRRESDDLLAVYPHATAGRGVHFRKSIKTWFWCSAIIYLVTVLLLMAIGGWKMMLDADVRFVFVIVFPFFLMFSGVIALRVSWKMMGFVRVAELIFGTFGWPDVRNIDLRKTSRESRQENKLQNYGNRYFRYGR